MSENPFMQDIAAFFTVLFLLIFGVLGGYKYGRETFRNEAIKAGAAEWVIDPATGEVRLQWRILSDEP